MISMSVFVFVYLHFCIFDLQIQKNAFIQHIKEMRLLDDLKQEILTTVINQLIKKTIFVLLLIDKVFSSSFHMNYQLLLKIVK